MKHIVPLLLLLATTASADKNLHGMWIRRLGGPKAESARRSLIAAGTYALKDLRLHAADANGPAARFAPMMRAIIAEIEKREPRGLLFSAGLPKMALTVDLVNSSKFKYSVRVRNKTERKVTIWPFLSLRLLDAAGNPVKPSRKLRAGIGGRPPQPVMIEPGKTWSFLDSLKRYGHDPEWITGWKVPAPGLYQLEFTYSFDAAAAKRYGKHGGAWDQVLAFRHTFTTEMRVG